METIGQTSSSCSNPYIMNLSNGAGYAEFQFHYPDTVMYVKLIGVEDKQNIEFNIDTLGSLEIKRVTLKKNQCIGSNIYDSEVSSRGHKLLLRAINFDNIDTAVIILNKNSFSNLCNYCDTSDLKFNLNIINQISTICNGNSLFCENLVRNGDLEQFAPQFLHNDINNPFMGTFILPNWGVIAFDENVTCGWDYDWYDQGGGNLMEVSPFYINSWFDLPATTVLCNGNMPFSTLTLCNNLTSFGLSSQSCNIQPQQNNYYFPLLLGTTNDGYVRSWLGTNSGGGFGGSRILKGQTIQQLQQNELYYLEVNIGASNSAFYGGIINIDVSNELNYNQCSYQGGCTPAANVELQINGFDYDSNSEWKIFNTVFTSNGNENRIYAGNLAQINSTPVASVNPLGTYCNTLPGTYFFDNFVVKKFFADAGASTVIACFDESVQLGGSSCPFPNATYSWTPANYFDDPASSNPMFTAPSGSPSNITVTLTVSITVNNGVLGNAVVESTSSTVNISVIQGSSITLSGATSVSPGGTTTLFANGGSNYVWTGSDGTSGTGSSINVGPLTQDVTYTVDAISDAGCKVTKLITVVVTTLPQACVNYQNTIIIPDGTDAAGLIALIPAGNITFSGSEYQITSVNFALAGQLFLNGNIPIIFGFCHFDCFDGSEIYNLGGSNIVLRVCTLEACNNVLWKGIRNDGEISVSSSLLKDARDGISMAPQSTNKITNSTFTNNYIGINIFGPCAFVNIYNIFENPDPLYPHWLGWNLPWALCGIRISDATFIQIDRTPTSSQLYTEFRKINCGILCQNTDLLVSNAYFNNIHDQFGLFNNPDGAAIYVQGTSANRLRVFPLNGINQAITFNNCDKGIYHQGYNTRLDYLGMQNVTRGIVGEQLAFCTNRMEYNNIEALSYGIEMKLIDDVDLFVINHNTITMSSKKARGIAVAAFSHNSSAGSNIKIQGNTIDITNGVCGIELNNVFHPKVNINKIFHCLATPINPSIFWNGIRTTNCLKSDVSCNELLVGTGIPNFVSGADIYVSQSQSSLIACNTTNGLSPTGIFLSSDNNASSIQTNEIGSHNIGLYLDNSCIIGPQPTPGGQPHGNRWNGSYGNSQYNGAGAVNENIWDNSGQTPILNFANIYANKFRIDETPFVYPFYPENYPDNIYNYNNDPTDNTDWFIEDNSFPTLASCTGGYCPHLENDGGGGENPSMSLNSSIAFGLIQTTGYPQETKWMLKKGLVSNLSRNDSLLNANDTMQVFYFSVDQENLKKLQQIADTTMLVKLYNQAIIEAMQANDSIMNENSMFMKDLIPMMEDSLLSDSIGAIVEQLMQQYKTIAAVNKTLSSQIIAQRNEAGVQGLMINAGIVPNNFNEYLERQVNDIYYRTYGQGVDTLSASDIATLSYISHICPQAGGPSIYKARALYQMVNDTVIYNDSVVCRNVVFFRESQELLMPNLKEKVKSNNFVVYPNPSKERLKMIITGNTEEGMVSVYNAMGALIQNVNIAKESNSKELDICNWAEGYYLIKYQTNNYHSQLKFIKIK